MATIDTLVDDIHGLLDEANHHETVAGPDIAQAYSRMLAKRDKRDTLLPLWASEYGDDCLRKVWYKRHAQDEQSPLAPYVRMKFMYGDVLEELLLALAKDAGHEVTGQQERVSIKGAMGTEILSGRMDAIIDGHVVDVKSMSTFAYKKYSEQGLSKHNDSFGYRWQVALYHHLMVEQGRVLENSQPYLLGIDKTLGHMALIPVAHLPSKDEVVMRAARMADAVTDEDKVPARGYEPVPDGASGNMKLDVACSYCDFKNLCWPGLRTFIYSSGPRFLTEVALTPKVAEVTGG
jgi:hypothetical protein